MDARGRTGTRRGPATTSIVLVAAVALVALIAVAAAVSAVVARGDAASSCPPLPDEVTTIDAYDPPPGGSGLPVVERAAGESFDAHFERQLVAIAELTGIGRHTLTFVDSHGIELRFHDGSLDGQPVHGSWYEPDTGSVVLDTSRGPVQRFPTLVHEVSHARWVVEGCAQDARAQSRDDYVATMVANETAAVVLHIQAQQQLQQVDPSVPAAALQRTYEAAYDAAVADAERSGGELSADERRLTGERAGAERLARAFTDGEVLPSTEAVKPPEQRATYPERFGEHWDRVNAGEDTTSWRFW